MFKAISIDIRKMIPDVTEAELPEMVAVAEEALETIMVHRLRLKLRSLRREFEVGDCVLTVDNERCYINHIYASEEWFDEETSRVVVAPKEYELRSPDGSRAYAAASDDIISEILGAVSK